MIDNFVMAVRENEDVVRKPSMIVHQNHDGAATAVMHWSSSEVHLVFNDSSHFHVAITAVPDSNDEYLSAFVVVDFAEQYFEKYVRLGLMYP